MRKYRCLCCHKIFKVSQYLNDRCPKCGCLMMEYSKFNFIRKKIIEIKKMLIKFIAGDKIAVILNIEMDGAFSIPNGVSICSNKLYRPIQVSSFIGTKSKD